MVRRVARIVGLLTVPSLLAVGLLAAPTVLAGDPCYHGFDLPARTVGTDAQIKLAPCAFAPTVTRIAPGSTVTFFNGPDFTHLITGANQEWGSRDLEVQPGQTVSYSFDKPGVYPYSCALHRGMSGTIVVGDPETALAAGATTGGSTSGGGGTDASATSAEAAGAESQTSSMAGLGPVALGAGAGIVIGAAAVALAVRRRLVAQEPLVHAD
jgi:plastocyanin